MKLIKTLAGVAFLSVVMGGIIVVSVFEQMLPGYRERA